MKLLTKVGQFQIPCSQGEKQDPTGDLRYQLPPKKQLSLALSCLLHLVADINNRNNDRIVLQYFHFLFISSFTTIIMKSKLRSRFQWGGGKNNGAFPTSKPNYASADASTTTSARIDIAPVRVGTLNLQNNPEILTAAHGNVTVSTLSNNDRAFSQKRFNCGFDSGERSTMREQMWYKNQTYLNENDNRDGGGVASNVASRYATDKRWSRYDNEEGSDAPDSPVGVSELDSFNQRLAERSDSETYTHQSSSMMDTTDDDCTSVYDDDGTR